MVMAVLSCWAKVVVLRKKLINNIKTRINERWVIFRFMGVLLLNLMFVYSVRRNKRKVVGNFLCRLFLENFSACEFLQKIVLFILLDFFVIILYIG